MQQGGEISGEGTKPGLGQAVFQLPSGGRCLEPVQKERRGRFGPGL